jgi:hypothetical protein
MTTIRGNVLERKNTLYIVTGTNLANDLVTYSTSFTNSGGLTGSFAAHGNAANVTAGYILLDLGTRLVPGQSPNVPTLMINVSVLPYDAQGRRIGSFPAIGGVTQVGITGYIDPNSPNVAIYSRDRPVDRNDNLYFSGAANLNLAGALVTDAYLQGNPGNTVNLTLAANGGGVRHLGPSSYTGGTLTAGGGNTLSATVTAASDSAGVITYTAENGFFVGQTVSITGLSAAALNLTNAIIATRSATQFTVRSTATGSVTGATGTAVATQLGVSVLGGGQRVNGALTLTNGPFVQTPVAVTASAIASNACTATLDLSLGSFFIVSTTGTNGAGITLTLTLIDTAPGAVVNIVVFNNATTQVVTVAFSAQNSILTTPAVSQTVANNARQLFVGTIFA